MSENQEVKKIMNSFELGVKKQISLIGGTHFVIILFTKHASFPIRRIKNLLTK